MTKRTLFSSITKFYFTLDAININVYIRFNTSKLSYSNLIQISDLGEDPIVIPVRYKTKCIVSKIT